MAYIYSPVEFVLGHGRTHPPAEKEVFGHVLTCGILQIVPAECPQANAPMFLDGTVLGYDPIPWEVKQHKISL